jgi:hypothetical protein
MASIYLTTRGFESSHRFLIIISQKPNYCGVWFIFTKQDPMKGGSMRTTVYLSIALLATSSLRALDFVKDVQPILEARCVKCHGESKQEGEYDMSYADGLMMGGESGELPVVAGEPAASYMVALLLKPHDDEERMPPKGGPLEQHQIKMIKAWIKAGAKIPAEIALKDKSKPKKATE